MLEVFASLLARLASCQAEPMPRALRAAWLASFCVSCVGATPAAKRAESREPLDTYPYLSPEFAIGRGVPGPGHNVAMPSIASDGTDYLVAFSESYVSHPHVFASRVRADGTVLDAFPIRLSTVTGQYDPAVAFDGVDYVVAFSDWVNLGDPSRIAFVRVDPVTGTVVDPQPVELATTAWSLEPRLAITPSGLMLIAYRVSPDNAAGSYIAGVMIRNGAVVVPEFTIASMRLSVGTPSVAWNGTTFLVVYVADTTANVDSSQILGHLVDTNGTPSPNEITIAATDGSGYHYETAPTAMSDGSSFLVVWADNHYCTGPLGLTSPCKDVYERVVASDGSTPNAAVQVSGNVQPEGLGTGDPAAALDPVHGNYVVIYGAGDGYTLRGVRVRASDGALLDTPPGVAIASSNRFNTVAGCSSTNCLVALAESDSIVAWAARGMRVDETTLSALDATPRMLAHNVNQQQSPVAASDGQSYLLVWSDNRDDPDALGPGNELYATRVGPDGMPLDSMDIPVALGPSAATAARLAFDGTDYVVVWQRMDPGTIVAARISRDGVNRDPGGRILAAQPQPCGTSSDPGSDCHYEATPAIACHPGQCDVVWLDTYYHVDAPTALHMYYQLMSASLASDGTLGSAQFVDQFDSLYGAGIPAIAAGPNGYLVTWPMSNGPGGQFVVTGRTLDANGAPVTQRTALSGVGATSAFDAIAASDGTNYLVVWDEEVSGGFNGYARLVGPDGVPLATAPVLVDMVSQTATWDATFDGSKYLVTWNGALMNWIAPDGSINASEEVQFADLGTRPRRAALASTGQGTSMVAYTRIDGTPDNDGLRLFGRFASLSAPPPSPDAGMNLDAGLDANGGGAGGTGGAGGGAAGGTNGGSGSGDSGCSVAKDADPVGWFAIFCIVACTLGVGRASRRGRALR